ncbi:uncharacterized protein PV06_07816 [Exophiala oligosperma]|uniref:Uncharacterized protein n=1 Tax=Exophiala oligosperma TaxID=215243 RepID=A0A0D2DDX0_9EURO|nr:uncharacterized protein PV06_07816 [Exophiala oligosperma]KIW40635.1 hypothetical protein PV06_07816 [Exophiala oligosperma]
MTEIASTPQTGVKSPPAADTMTEPGANENGTADNIPSQETLGATPATLATSANRGKGMSTTRSHVNYKFDPATENEIRDLMQNARNVDKTHHFKSDKDTTKLAHLATNLIQLLNAEYIAKDIIVRAVAYMQGESQVPPHRALTQAHRDRKAERRNTHSGQKPHNITNGNSRVRATSEGIKGALGNSKVESSTSATPQKADVNAKAVDSPSQSSSNGESPGNATGSEKENTSPASAHVTSNKLPKKSYWKNRREAKKRAVSHNAGVAGHNESGSTNSKAEPKDAATSQATHNGSVVVEAKDTTASKGHPETAVKQG